MAKNIATRPAKTAKEEALIGTHHGYTISLRSADPMGYSRSAGKQYTIEGPKNEALIQHLRSAGARWDGVEKVWTIAKSSSSKLTKIVEQLPEILAGQAAAVSKDLEAVQDLLRPISGYGVNDRRWHGLVAVEMSKSGSGLTIYAAVGPRTAKLFLEIGCKPEPDRFKHKKFWLPLSKHRALRDLIERLPSILDAWAEEKRQQIAAVVGTHGAYTVKHLTVNELAVKGPNVGRFIAAMKELSANWNAPNEHWLVQASRAVELLAVMTQVEGWHAEALEVDRKAKERKAAETAAKAAARKAEDDLVGRIYITERNVWKGFQLPNELWRNGDLYRLEAQTYAGAEYGDDGDWMVSGSYLPASETEQADREAEIAAYEATEAAVKAAKAEVTEIAKAIAVDKIKWLPSNRVRIFSSPDAAPFCSIYLTDPGMAAVSFEFSDYSTEHTGPITEEQAARIKEIADIIAQGDRK